MRKLIYSALAAIGLLLSPSCSDENEIVNGSGNEALVSFTVNLADGIQTKAISDGKTAKKLYVKVFDKDLHYLPDISRTYDLTDKRKDVTLDLVKGKTYNFLFWAQCEDEGWHSPYTISDVDGSITIDYDNAASNKEERDAFLATEKNFTVTGSFTKQVYLYRPFAQLNFLTTKKDIEDALKAHIIPENTELKSSVTLSKVAKTLHPFTNTVSGEATDVEFKATLVPVTFDTNGKVSESSDQVRIKNRVTVKPSDTGYESATAYYYLATNYFLIGNKENDRKLITATMKIDGADGKLEVNNVPVEWNYRTNIYGDLLTASNKFNVIINPGYTDDRNNANEDINSAHPVTVASTDEIATQITNGSRDVTCTQNIDTNVTIEIPLVFSDADKNLSLKFTGTVAEGKKVTITAEDGTTGAPKEVLVKTNGGDLTVNLEHSTVTLTGTVNNVISSTAPTTLIIAADMVVKQSINADKGGVLVLGQVGTELSAGSNAITATDADATITIQQGALVTGNVKAKNDIVVHGSVTGDLKSDTKIQLSSEATVTGDLDAGEKEIAPGATTPSANISEYTINTADDLFAFAKQVNEEHNTYAGKTVVLANDIDLAGRAWMPIGKNTIDSYPNGAFAGTFDGQSHTISNLTTSSAEPGFATAGLFGTVTGATIKNVKLSNVKVSSTHYAGAIVGYHSDGTLTIEKCSVDGATLTSTPEQTSSGYDNGDKVGGIVGYTANGTVSNCTVSNVTIKAYRGLGGIAGQYSGSATNNVITNLTLIIDATHDYKGSEYEANARPIIGNAEVEGNTTTNVVYQVASETALTQAMTYAQDATVQLAAGTYSNVINVKGKRLTIEPIQGAKVVIAGVDGQQNGEHTGTITCNNITFDNSKQTAGWYTGTGQNIYPCVGAWGGDFTFNNCTFLVEGTTGKETGIMTWWTTEETKMKFYGCTFNGIEDHTEARGMQIYGHVNLTVANCTFTTKKRYALKYVGNEGYSATLKNNNVSGCGYMVELGSSTYPGSNYTVTFENNTLADGIYEYKVANNEGATINGGTSVPTGE